MQRAKDNVETIQSIVHSWGCPIFERSDSKRESVLSLGECQERLERRCSLVTEGGLRIHSLLQVRGHLQPCLAPQRLLCPCSTENVQSCFALRELPEPVWNPGPG